MAREKKQRPSPAHLTIIGKLISAISWPGKLLFCIAGPLSRPLSPMRVCKLDVSHANVTILVHSADDDESRQQQSAACLAAISSELAHAACFPTLNGGLAPFDENLFCSHDQASAELDFPNVRLAACTQEQLSVFNYTKQTQACIQTLYKEVLKLPELSKHTVSIVQCKAAIWGNLLYR